MDYFNPVDGDEVPVMHFGAVLSLEDFEILEERLKKVNTKFIIEPHWRFVGQKVSWFDSINHLMKEY